MFVYPIALNEYNDNLIIQIAGIIGILISYLEIEMPTLIDRSINFISASDSPWALFSASIILAQKIEKTKIQLCDLIILLKIILHLILAIFIIYNILEINFSIS